MCAVFDLDATHGKRKSSPRLKYVVEIIHTCFRQSAREREGESGLNLT